VERIRQAGIFNSCSFLAAYGHLPILRPRGWLPLGGLNNLAGIRAVDTKMRLMRTTVLSALPFAIALAGSAYYSSTHFPTWLIAQRVSAVLEQDTGLIRAP
jgi:hypothetical protein